MKSYFLESVAHFIDIQLDWPNIDGGVVKAGTPISLAGRVANDETAIGLLADDAIFVNAANANPAASVLVEGVVAIDGAETDSGLTFSDAAIKSLKDITFIDSSGAVVSVGGEGLPDPSELEDGTIAIVQDGAWVTAGELETWTFTVDDVEVNKLVVVIPVVEDSGEVE